MLKVSDHGMVVDGIDVVAHSTTHNIKIKRHRQLWWVFVWTDEAIDRCEGEDPLGSLADAQWVESGSALGF